MPVKFKARAFHLIRGEGTVLVLPISLLDELSTLPSSIASPNGALEQDLLGPYTGLDLILESRLHHSIVQRKLTPRLGVLTPGLEDELKSAIEDYFPPCDEWTEFMPYQLFGKISARLAGKALVGPALCRDLTWLDISVNYTECLFETIVILRLFPNWLHPVLYRALPSFWRGQGYVRSAKTLLGPIIRDLLCKNDNGLWSPADKEEDSNVLCWLVDTAKGKDRDADTLAHVEVLLALASVHTTLLRMVNVLYDLAANPGYFDELRAEIESEAKCKKGWNEASYSQLHKLDSVLRESQRMSPPTTLGLKRLFKQSYTFADGLYIPKGTYACLPTFAIENDPEHTLDPEIFDGLRSYRRSQQTQASDSKGKGNREEHQFFSPGRTTLNFGYGKSACPGRYFASLVLKILFVKLLSEYEFKFLSGGGRPKNIMAHEFLFCWPWQKMMIRRKENGICPF
ncbi:hypothetical protein MMC11_008377 [Xylographa trunciseda]|nr:hypothetical protein [Xylographa trunciseda]